MMIVWSFVSSTAQAEEFSESEGTTITVQKPCNPEKELCNPLGEGAARTNIPTLIGSLMRYGFGLLGSIALVMFMYGGFLWLTSGGVADKIKKGQDTMIWTALGMAAIFASYAIVGFVIKALTKT